MTASTLPSPAPSSPDARHDATTIGLIGLVSDLAFKRANRALFRWASL